MSPIAVVTGAPGTGKTTVAAQLAKASARIALAHAAATFSSRGYEVYLDGIFGPWFLPVIAAELRSTEIPVDYVVLRAPLEIALGRVQTREGQGKDHIVRQMHAAFSELGPYSGHAVETADRAPEEVVSEIVRRRRLGVFALDLGRVVSMSEGHEGSMDSIDALILDLLASGSVPVLGPIEK